MKLEELKERLSDPFPEEVIKYRKAKPNDPNSDWLPYVTAHIVEHRLDKLLGFDNWDCEFYDVAGKVYCKLGICVEGKWIYKSDCGEETGFSADKGQASDAFKRAAKKFGIGRHLWINPPKYNKAK